MTIIEQIKTKIEDWLREYAEDSQFELGKRYGYKRLLSFLSTLESEKPINQERLDENIKHYIEDCGWEKDSTIPVSFARQIASHFYDLGCRRTAEKYDEIEYNRQRAEESVPNDLEEAAGEYEKKHTYQRYDGGGFTPEYDATLAESFIAGAKWDREHVMKEAVEGEVMDFCFVREVNYSRAAIEFVKIPRLQEGDKVIVIVKKED